MFCSAKNEGDILICGAEFQTKLGLGLQFGGRCSEGWREKRVTSAHSERKPT
ncbi:hypothetical protein TRSA_02130 [Treponema saccharophilum]|nr:hypothetical protein TRSA_02130 [Treponema saccharophilum]